ncbi:MAG: hypothetical protein ACI8RZ_001795 [Myxococcota bacterium]|jgi:hypothetical protein
MVWWLFLAEAMAGGPWVLSAGDFDVYSGLESRRATTLTNSTGDGNTLPGGGVSTMGAVGILSAGILPGLQGSIQVPIHRSRSLASDDTACDDLGLGACKTSQGIGTVTMQLKGQVLDELYGAPVSAALVGELRLGDLTAPTRARLTSLGEGTTDLGVFASVGHSGGLGSGFWSGQVEGGWRYRFPNATVSGQSVPGSEILANLEVLAGSAAWSIGPTAYFMTRAGGVTLEETDLTSTERYVALQTTSAHVGGKLLLRSAANWTVSLSGLRSVFSQNGFGDELIISAGVSVWRPAKTL